MRTTRRGIPTLTTICVVLSVGCASSGYRPEEPGRIIVVRASGGTVLEKDGKQYSMSGFRSDSIEAVSGHPAAEEHARTFVSRTRTSAAIGLLGFASMFGGAALMTTEPGHTERKIAASGITIASGVTAIVSLLALVSAQHHLYDAINIYNDDVSARNGSGLPIVEAPGSKEPR